MSQRLFLLLMTELHTTELDLSIINSQGFKKEEEEGWQKKKEEKEERQEEEKEKEEKEEKEKKVWLRESLSMLSEIVMRKEIAIYFEILILFLIKSLNIHLKVVGLVWAYFS